MELSPNSAPFLSNRQAVPRFAWIAGLKRPIFLWRRAGSVLCAIRQYAKCGRANRQGPLQLAAIALCLTVTCLANAEPANVVDVLPGQSIQQFVETNPPGTVFRIRGGVHRNQQIAPKDRQYFIGEPDTILSGSMLLTAWQRSGELWRHDGLPPPLPEKGVVASGGLLPPRGDLFVDDERFRPVASISDVADGTWYRDAATGSAYLSIDVLGRRIELATTEFAFSNSAEGVEIRDIIVEKYASPPEIGAINGGDGRSWRIENVIVRWNHGSGLQVSPFGIVSGGRAVDNGQLGVSGNNAHNAVIQGMEIARNNWAGYDWNWEAGGIKITESRDVQIIGNHVHHNYGAGIWGDIDMERTIYRNNVVVENEHFGIIDEISVGAIIEGNRLLRNGNIPRTRLEHFAELGGEGQGAPNILIQNSRAVRVRNNYVEVAAEMGSGIVLTYENRGAGRLGPYETKDNEISGNTVVHLGTRGPVNGFFAWYRPTTAYRWSNHWAHNIYIIPDCEGRYWMVRGQAVNCDDLVRITGERGSQFHIEHRTPTP